VKFQEPDGKSKASVTRKGVIQKTSSGPLSVHVRIVLVEVLKMVAVDVVVSVVVFVTVELPPKVTKRVAETSTAASKIAPARMM